jgi:hypothetical protein
MSMSIPQSAPREPEGGSEPRPSRPGLLERLREIKEFIGVVSAIAMGLVGLVGQFGSTVSVPVEPLVAVITFVAVCTVGIRMYVRPVTNSSEHGASVAEILRGLVPFEEGDPLPARKSDLDTLAGRVSAQGTRLFVIAGRPGCGKTSIVHAGLIPRLRKDGIFPVFIPEPGVAPSVSIVEGVQAATGVTPTAEESASFARSLGSVATRISQSHPRGLVVICDQFERFARTAPVVQQRAFAKDVWAAVRESRAPVRFLFVVQDYLKRDLSKLLSDEAGSTAESVAMMADFDVTNLDRHEAKAVIDEIVQRGEARLDRSLRNAILDAFNGSGASPSLLQVLVSRLRDDRIVDLCQYRAVRGSVGILGSQVVAALRDAADPGFARLMVERAAADSSAQGIPFDGPLTEYYGPLGASKKARERAEIESLGPLLRARVLSRRSQHTFSLFDGVLRGPARAALVEIADTDGNVARAKCLLAQYVEQADQDRRTVVPREDLRVIQAHVPVDDLLEDRARTLLERSERAVALHRARLAVAGLSGLLLLSIVLLVAALLAAARPGWQRELEFKVVDEGTTFEVEPGPMAIEPRRGVVMITSIGDSLGLYFLRIPDGGGWHGLGVDINTPMPIQAAQRIEGTKHTKFTSLAVDPNGAFFVTGGANGTIRQWNAERLSLEATRPIRSVAPNWADMDEKARGCEAIEGLSVGANGAYVLSATRCGLVQLWKPSGSTEPEASVTLQGKVVEGGIAVSKDGQTAMVRLRAEDEGGHDRIVELTRVGNTFRGRPLALPDPNGTVVALGIGSNERPVIAWFAADWLYVGHFDDEGEYRAGDFQRQLQGVKTPSAVLSPRTRAIGFKGWDVSEERSTVGWHLWRAGDDEPSTWELDDLRRAFLSADGSRLVLAEDLHTSTVYRWDSWVANLRLGWWHPGEHQ